MLITLVIILILIWAAVVWSIYSNFLVFYSNFWESENYHRAYYASVSALERWELVVKQRKPWYEWSGGFIRWTWTWSITDWWSDRALSWFSYLWDRQDETTVFRIVKSRTTRIPSEWNGNVEDMLVYKDSIHPEKNSDNYNMMDYENAEIFLLSNDRLEGNPYTGGTVENAGVGAISWEIRLPALLTSSFWSLDYIYRSLIWVSNALPPNDAIVDRQIRWEYEGSSFTLYSTPSIEFPPPHVNENQDSVFREKDINYGLAFNFWTNLSPFKEGHRDGYPTIISQNESGIKEIMNSSSWGLNYKSIFNGTNNPELRFSLLNLVEWYGGSGSTWHIYPFLEYYADFWTEVPDKYFTIDAEWSFKDYQVNTIVQKPTTKESILWNFTSIF